MAPSSRPFAAAAAALLLLLSATGAAAVTNPAAAVLCRHSDFPVLCLRIAAPVANVNPVSLTHAAIKAATKTAVRAKARAAVLTLSPRLSAVQKANLGSCVDGYGDVIDGLRDAGKFLTTTRTRADVMNYLSAASFGVTTCEDAFRETPRVQFPLARTNKTLRKYVSNALAMGDQLSLQW
ncbi:hypothetical protein AXF42_Ash012902 [Apostasia shenzhenica]|uniref:Pectinesterase inhibitor domain-containing protein n=1 Tax=Apostasia shenzhenica TaxID=1088818 RepID=A0A2I0ARJ5_9ASPA|nr:hypothetical protein AXF42_Ash012902 [Apostasia shenzhenica]